MRQPSVDERHALREKLESLDIGRGFLFGAAIAVPFWLGVAGLILLVAVVAR